MMLGCADTVSTKRSCRDLQELLQDARTEAPKFYFTKASVYFFSSPEVLVARVTRTEPTLQQRAS